MDSKYPASVETTEQKHGDSAAQHKCQTDGTGGPAPAADDPGHHELPKRLIRGSWPHAMIVVFTHAPALAISAVLVSLNSTATFWFGVNLDVPIPMGGGRTVNVSVANIMHLLQLAAKVSELLFIFSLSKNNHNKNQNKKDTTGLPLGMITAGFRTG